MEQPLISIIVPIYNVSKYLDRCMDTILNQTYKNLEIIMVDDESPDDCGKKCDEYAKKDDRIVVIHKKNAGLGMARNSGLEIAKGQYVGFVDSDDYVSKDMFEKLYETLKKNNADTCFGRYYDVDSNGNARDAKEYYKRNLYQGNQVKELILAMIGSLPEAPGDVEIGMSVWKSLYSMELIKKYNLRFPSEREFISEDIVFHMEYLQKAQVVVVCDNFGYYYCDNGASLTKSYKTDRFEKEKILYLKEQDELRKIFKEEEFEQRLYKAFMGRVRRCLLQETGSNLNKKQIKRNMKKICEDQCVQNILKDIDNKKNTYSKKIVNIMIKYKMFFALEVVMKIKNSK